MVLMRVHLRRGTGEGLGPLLVRWRLAARVVRIHDLRV